MIIRSGMLREEASKRARQQAAASSCCSGGRGACEPRQNVVTRIGCRKGGKQKREKGGEEESKDHRTPRRGGGACIDRKKLKRRWWLLACPLPFSIHLLSVSDDRSMVGRALSLVVRPPCMFACHAPSRLGIATAAPSAPNHPPHCCTCCCPFQCLSPLPLPPATGMHAPRSFFRVHCMPHAC